MIIYCVTNASRETRESQLSTRHLLFYFLVTEFFPERQYLATGILGETDWTGFILITYRLFFLINVHSEIHN